MTSNDILRTIPHADPNFVDIVLRVPKPTATLEHRLLMFLPRLHEMFVRKQAALGKIDAQDWDELLKLEARFIHGADSHV